MDNGTRVTFLGDDPAEWYCGGDGDEAAFDGDDRDM